MAAAVAESLGRSGIVVDILAAMPSEAEPQNYGARRSESHRLSATAAAQPRGTIRVSSCYLFVLRQAAPLRIEEQCFPRASKYIGHSSDLTSLFFVALDVWVLSWVLPALVLP